MYFDIITIFPDMFSAITKEGVVARAINNNILKKQYLRVNQRFPK